MLLSVATRKVKRKTRFARSANLISYAMEADDLARRILFDISMVFKRQPNLYDDEFDIIPVLESQNKSPVVHVDRKMALEAWCVKLLYLYAHSNLTQWRERRTKSDDEKAVQWSEIALLLNPEVLTFWNIRKELLDRGKIEQNEELRLCTLILTRKPKSPEVFSHRRWLVKKAMMPTSSSFDDDGRHRCVVETRRPSDATPPANADEILKNELHLCTVGASRYPNNYSAWSHRQWAHDNIVSPGNDTAETMNHLMKDLKWSEEWVERNVSDHSGLQFRQYLLTKVAKLINACDSVVFDDDDEDGRTTLSSSPSTSVAQIFGAESHSTNRLIRDFPGHESLWYHRRFVVQSCRSFGILDDFSPTTCKKTKIDATRRRRRRHSKSPSPTTVPRSDFRLNLDDEIHFADKQMSIGSATPAVGQQAQSNLASAYKRWLLHMFGPFPSTY